MKIVFTDLDSTFLNSDAKISKKNMDTLFYLQKKGVVTVAATGRNIFSCNNVLSPDLPFDYLIFSTGIGMMDFKSKKIINSHHFEIQQSLYISSLLIQLGFNIFIHNTVPDNHFFYYQRSKHNPDFESRFKIYENFGTELKSLEQIKNVSQFVLVLNHGQEEFVRVTEVIHNNTSNIKIIRATSPINHKNIWLEVYPENVSKGNSAIELCELLNIDIKDSIAIGNDYNDIELLEVAGKSFIVENAPEELKSKYEVVASNDNDGFSEAVLQLIS
ncbi:MAG: HAD-IIB family hydrolase [Bacteroidales bacterium]|nr:HAD-IIB family hydrolase [Bacteroidales bacterium]